MVRTEWLGDLDDCRSMIKATFGDGHIEYVVCFGFDREKPIGQQWYWGTYFMEFQQACNYAARYGDD